MIQIKRILSLVLLTLMLASCSKFNSSKNINTLEQNSIQPTLSTTESKEKNIGNTYTLSDSETETSRLEELIKGKYEFHEPIFVGADKLKYMEYLLLVKEGKGYFTNTDLWYEYALLGGEYDTYEKGKNHYDKINGLYKKELVSANSEEAEKKYGAGVVHQFYKRHIIAFSADGEKVLLKQYIAPFKSDEILYEVYKGDSILRTYLYYEIIDREHVNYTTNLEYISLSKERDVFYKTDINEREEQEKTYSLSTATDVKDTVYYKGGVDEEGRNRIMLYSIPNNELVFESDPIEKYPHTVTILENKLIVGYYSQAEYDDYFNYLDYFEIDIDTNESKYLFTNRDGVFSPEGKYLAYATDYTPDDGSVLVEKGYYIYCVETSETAFILTQIRDRENDYYVQPDRLNNIIGWAHIDGLEALLK